MKKRLKLKKEIWLILILLLFATIGLYAGKKIYQEKQYQKTINYKLINYGYTPEEVESLLAVFTTEEEQNYLLNIAKDSNIIALTNEKYFLKKNFKDYLTYMHNNQELSLKEVVRNINIHLNYDFYAYSLEAKDELEELMLVNKYYLLNKDYNPDDLVTISQNYSWGSLGSKKIRKVAYDAFLDMWNAAYADGFYLMVNSSYRTYTEQETIYNNKMKKEGSLAADKTAARPGASEHQTGLALDIFSKNNSNQKTFGTTLEAQWLKDNAYKYGFILRYPDGLKNITGYDYEPWHFRYVGLEVAKYIYENDITFEEYYAYFIEK